MTWTHDGLLADLAAYLRQNPSNMVWTDMPMGPGGSERPDAFVLPKSFAQPHPLTYEIKVSVGDYRGDVTSGKWQKYLKYSAGVIFAVPQGLIDKKDLPQGCGLIVRGPETWRMSKRPVLHPVENLPKSVWMKLLMAKQTTEVLSGGMKPREEPNIWTVSDKLNKKFGEKVAKLVREALTSEVRLQAALEASEKQRRELDAGTHSALQRRLEALENDFERHRKLIPEALSGLTEVLGLQGEPSVREITSAIRQTVRDIQDLQDTKQVTQVLESSISNMKRLLRRYEWAGELLEKLAEKEI